MRPFIDAVIEHHIDDMLQIQSQAPKSIRIKGKTFHLNPVHRITKWTNQTQKYKQSKKDKKIYKRLT